ncbi:MAG: hypothetical protein ACTSXK_05525 [Promethearchaeota archaeon]
MKGILIVSVDFAEGIIIEREFPNNIAKEMEINSEVLTEVYQIHSNIGTVPNFEFLPQISTSPKLHVASFYTGKDPAICTGEPNYCIISILDEFELETYFDWDETLQAFAKYILPLNEYLKEESIYQLDNKDKEKLDEEENFSELFQEKLKEIFGQDKFDEIIKSSTKKDEEDKQIIDYLPENHPNQEEHLEIKQEDTKSSIKKSNKKDLFDPNSLEFGEKMIEKIEMLSKQLNYANKRSLDAFLEISEEKAHYIHSQKKVDELTKANRKLEDKITFFENKIFELEEQNQSLVAQLEEQKKILSSKSNITIPEKDESFNIEIARLQAELIKSKKSIKIQSREIINLKKLLDLE